jgi:molybdopterin/thiamine biosynthesis adenylyltransferase
MITIIGCGALGSHVGYMLRNEDDIRMVDFDRVEAKNVEAQFHTKMGLGKNKASAFAASMRGLFGIEVDQIIHKLEMNNAMEVIGDPKLVIDCTDNKAARDIIQRYCKVQLIPCLHGATAASGDFARVVWSEHFVPDYEGEGEHHTCENGDQLPFFCFVASRIALLAQLFLTTEERHSEQLLARDIIRIA